MTNDLTTDVTGSIQAVIAGVDDTVPLEDPLFAVNWFDTKSAWLYFIYNVLCGAQCESRRRRRRDQGQGDVRVAWRHPRPARYVAYCAISVRVSFSPDVAKPVFSSCQPDADGGGVAVYLRVYATDGDGRRPSLTQTNHCPI